MTVLKEIHRMINTGDVVTHNLPIGSGVHGYVYESRKGRKHIFIDSDLSPETTLETLIHEYHHIIEDISKGSRLIGLDCRKSDREEQAELFVKETKRNYY